MRRQGRARRPGRQHRSCRKRSKRRSAAWPKHRQSEQEEVSEAGASGCETKEELSGSEADQLAEQKEESGADEVLAEEAEEEQPEAATPEAATTKKEPPSTQSSSSSRISLSQLSSEELAHLLRTRLAGRTFKINPEFVEEEEADASRVVASSSVQEKSRSPSRRHGQRRRRSKRENPKDNPAMQPFRGRKAKSSSGE